MFYSPLLYSFACLAHGYTSFTFILTAWSKNTSTIDTYAEALLLDLEHLMATLDQMAHKNSSFKISELLTSACNSENSAVKASHESSNVFSNVKQTDMDQIYSSTLTVQPIHQINLPDTHIFTPTDSKTPRSKTIHYDQVSSMLVPQASERSQQSDELKFISKNEANVQNTENDEDYWEFQDFKCNSSSNKSSTNQDNTSVITNSNLPQVISSCETQILQPIKVEPIAPALNWPDPGEVKETFDDFTEFISNTPWNNDNTNTDSHQDSPLKTNLENGIKIVDDDFETFQSAPSLTIPTINNTSNVDNFSFNEFPQQTTNISNTSHTTHSNTNNVTITLKENIVQNELTLINPDSFSGVKESNIKILPAFSASSQSQVKNNATIMQPSVANANGSQRSQQKTGQILQPLSLESYSQINWPSPGIDLQDLSRFNPLESLQSLKSDISTGGSSRLSSPAHKDINPARNEVSDEDIWGDFVSSKPKSQHNQTKKVVFADDDEWTDFVSSPSVKPQNGLNTISLNVHTNLNMQKPSGPINFHPKNNKLALDIPTLNYVTPKSSNRGSYNDKHFQNL